jgi:hypothetical protein
MNSGKQAPATSSAENALVMAQRQNEMKQRRKALTSSANKGIRMNMSTNSLPELSGYFDDGAWPMFRVFLATVGVQRFGCTLASSDFCQSETRFISDELSGAGLFAKMVGYSFW